VTNIGCYRWEGTFETEVTIDNGVHNYTDFYSGRVVFAPKTNLPANPIYQYYELVELSVEWVQEGVVGDCTVQGEATLANMNLAAGNLQTASYSVDAEMDYRLHTGTVSYEDGGTVTMTCPYGTFTNDKSHGVIAAFGQGTKPITANGLVLQGRHAETYVGSGTVTEWRMEAKAQP
jgi:hypothetical protein